MKTLKWFFFTLTALSLAACAFDKNSNTDTQRELEDNAALEAKFARVTGKYVGTINTGAEPQQVELSFYPYYKKNGQNSKGEDKYKPELRARYRLLNTVAPDVILSVGYYEEVNKLVMTTLNENAPTVISINGEMMGNSITGDVAKNNVPFGTLTAELTSRQYSAPSPNDEAEYNQRLRRLYDTIKGNYVGTVRPSPRDGAAFQISVRLGYVDRKSPNSNVLTPVLEAYYSVIGDRDHAREDQLAVTFIPETNEISMDAGAARRVSISGTLRQGVIKGTYTGFRGLEGGVTLRKSH